VSAQSPTRVVLSYLAMAFAAMVVAGGVGGFRGVAGMALGVGSGMFGALVLWRLILLFGAVATSGRSTKLGIVTTILAFFAKLPLYILCGMLAARIGHPAFGSFLAGLVLVYFCLIAWAVGRNASA